MGVWHTCALLMQARAYTTRHTVRARGVSHVWSPHVAVRTNEPLQTIPCTSLYCQHQAARACACTPHKWHSRSPDHRALAQLHTCLQRCPGGCWGTLAWRCQCWASEHRPWAACSRWGDAGCRGGTAATTHPLRMARTGCRSHCVLLVRRTAATCLRHIHRRSTRRMASRLCTRPSGWASTSSTPRPFTAARAARRCASASKAGRRLQDAHNHRSQATALTWRWRCCCPAGAGQGAEGPAA